MGQQEAATGKLVVGRRVRFSAGYGGIDGEGLIVSIYGEPNPAPARTIANGIGRVIRPNDCTFDVILFDGRSMMGRHQCSVDAPGIGIKLLDRVHSPELIAAMQRKAAARSADEALAKSMAAQHHAEEVAAVIVANPHLQPLTPENRYGKIVGNNIRAEFKKAGIKKASVRSDGGDCYRITLPHDVSDEHFEVAEGIGNRFELGSFDGMTDSYEYSATAWTDAFGGVRYVFVQRDWRAQA